MKKLPLKSEAFQYIEKSFKEWLDVLGYAQSTVYQMPNYIRELFHYLECRGHTQINQITIPLIKEYYEELKNRRNQRSNGALSNNYLNKQLQALYKFMDYLRKTSRLTLPHLEINREEADPKAIQVLTVAEIKLLYKAAGRRTAANQKEEFLNARDRAMLSVFYGCGLRRTESVSLDIGDVNWEKSILHVRYGKNYKERLVPFNKSNAKILQDYIYDYRPYFLKENRAAALFIGVGGARLEGQSMAMRLKILQQRTDDIELQQKDFSLHTLRHSIATHLLSAGMSLEKIARFLGHTSLESTQIYTHLIAPENKN